MSYHCPLCEGAVKHVTDDIFRCPACRWNGANVIEQRPPEVDDDDQVKESK